MAQQQVLVGDFGPENDEESQPLMGPQRHFQIWTIDSKPRDLMHLHDSFVRAAVTGNRKPGDIRFDHMADVQAGSAMEAFTRSQNSSNSIHGQWVNSRYVMCGHSMYRSTQYYDVFVDRHYHQAWINTPEGWVKVEATIG